jgi:enoyl-CoA hydratase
MSFGRTFSGEEGERLGLVNYAVDDAALEQETRRIAREIAAVEPELLMINKMLVNRTWEIRGLQTAIAYGGELDTLSHMSNTARPFFDVLERHGGDLAAALKELNLPWAGV